MQSKENSSTYKRLPPPVRELTNQAALALRPTVNRYNKNTIKMLTTSFLLAALAATGLAQVPAPAGYRKVYITSNVNTKFVVVPKAPAKAGTTLVVQTLNNKPEQQWYIKEGSAKIQLVDTTLCMDAGAKSKDCPTTNRNRPNLMLLD